MLLFYQPDLVHGATYLDREESRHCVKVLRKRQNDLIHITDGQGYLYSGIITKDDPVRCEFKIDKKKEEERRDFSVHIAIAPTKNTDRLEWFIEKATEIGVDEITLLKTTNCERTVVKIERLEKKAVAAMKQSLKCRLPKINDISAFEDTVKLNADFKSIAYVDTSNSVMLSHNIGKGVNYILIGPEGDFTETEVGLAQKSGWSKVSLGQSRLRTETAGLVACHLINLFQ
ncbi:MAG: 16S rRNA (uracil(1498)-N(3))-methyltransferase [Bacteroidota bacterium]